MSARRLALPLAWHEQTEHEVACAYAAGHHQALVEAAERADALDQSWRPRQRRSPEQVVRERVAEMEQLARRPGWPGLDNGGVLPAADWVPDTAALRAGAERWLAIAARYEPEPCTRCRPAHPVLCRCGGVVTLVPRQGRWAA